LRVAARTFSRTCPTRKACPSCCFLPAWWLRDYPAQMSAHRRLGTGLPRPGLLALVACLALAWLAGCRGAAAQGPKPTRTTADRLPGCGPRRCRTGHVAGWQDSPHRRRPAGGRRHRWSRFWTNTGIGMLDLVFSPTGMPITWVVCALSSTNTGPACSSHAPISTRHSRNTRDSWFRSTAASCRFVRRYAAHSSTWARARG